VLNSVPKIAGGFILLSRTLFQSDIMARPPLYLKLWVWVLLMANWQDRDKLKRGQLVTTIASIQEAMSYFVGYRKIKPTKDEIRNAYEALVKATMITTTRTTRGMIITICNYDFYQNPANYEAHYEPHNENAAKPSATPHDTEEGEERNKSKTLPVRKDLPGSKLFSDWFCYAFNLIQGYPYRFEGAKDGKCVNEMLKSISVKNLVAKCCHYLVDENRFPPSKAPTISFLRQRVNEYPDTPNDKLDYFREVGLLPPEGMTLEEWKPWEQ